MEERIPGESLPVRAVLRGGGEELGVLVGHLPATRRWERADQDLLELFASEIAVAIRNAQLFARVEAQNAPAARARRGEGRLPARRQPQPPDAADEHPRLRRPARPRPPGPAARDHRRAVRPAVADGPPAADRDAARVGRPAAAERGRRAGAPGSAGRGRRSAPSDVAVRARRPSRPAGWPSPTSTSSTRSCGRCSTTP